MKKTKIICIVGATGSGKTSLAVFLAKRFNGEIISADSRQVYKGLDIGTNKDLLDYGQIKYHLIDIIEPGEKFTVFDWKNKAEQAIKDILSKGKLPIVAGGTGLYVQALVEGFQQQNQKSKVKSQNYKSNVKIFSREELDQKTLEELRGIYSNFQTLDSKIDINNPRRLIRAIEKAQEGIVETKLSPDFDTLQIGISLPRPLLYEKIDKNVEKWFECGFFKEVRGLIDSGVDTAWLKSIGLNYRLASEFIINGDTNIENLKDRKSVV